MEIYRRKIDNVICPQCNSSNVIQGHSTTTAVYYPPFYDDKHRLHHHDNNVVTTEFTCENGHAWTLTYQGKCWCGK